MSDIPRDVLLPMWPSTLARFMDMTGETILGQTYDDEDKPDEVPEPPQKET